MINIKKLQRAEWKINRDLRLEALKLEPQAFCSTYEKEKEFSEDKWRQRTGNVLIAFSEKKPVGMVVAIKDDEEKNVINIYGFYVNKKFRNRGIGAKLIGSAIEKSIKNKKIAKIRLSVNSSQKSAIRVYQRFGFKKVAHGRTNGKKAGCNNEVLMEKNPKFYK